MPALLRRKSILVVVDRAFVIVSGRAEIEGVEEVSRDRMWMLECLFNACRSEVEEVEVSRAQARTVLEKLEES